jgi:hypothetical protein
MSFEGPINAEYEQSNLLIVDALDRPVQNLTLYELGLKLDSFFFQKSAANPTNKVGFFAEL